MKTFLLATMVATLVLVGCASTQFTNVKISPAEADKCASPAYSCFVIDEETLQEFVGTLWDKAYELGVEEGKKWH